MKIKLDLTKPIMYKTFEENLEYVVNELSKDEEPVLGKFVETEHWRNTTTYKICTSPEAYWTCRYFEYCEPFIGTLPTKWRNK